ncbi:MAG: GtrA family protein [Actinomycetota bacterium]|nr:GtrA family protein [Actinomycetota bacterium]
MSSSRPGLLGRLETRLRGVFAELAKFGTVGALSFVIDVAIFNAVLLVMDKPLTAKIISTVFSATNAFVLNRAWSFKHRERTNVRREYSLFFLFNAVGLAIALLCLAVSHYVLGFESRLADNIAANGIGLVLGTTFRFWSYRRFVWAAPSEVEDAAVGGDAAARAVLDDVADGTVPRP